MVKIIIRHSQWNVSSGLICLGRKTLLCNITTLLSAPTNVTAILVGIK